MFTRYVRHLNITLLLLSILIPACASAHQARLVEGTVVSVIDPEISKAYYGTLVGGPHVFHITSIAPFDLYINVLVPDINGQKTDVSVMMIKNGSTTLPLASLGGVKAIWSPMFEEFGHDNYLQSAAYKSRVDAGEYDIWVTSVNNDSKYVLAVGETESFDLKEGMNALALVPKLKKDFFNESPIGFILSPFGVGYIVVMFLLSMLFGLLYRHVVRVITKRSNTTTPRVLGKNINRRGRALRAFAGLGLFLLAITTSWSPILLFFSGFCFFEAIFSWCGFNAAIGKSTCPIE